MDKNLIQRSIAGIIFLVVMISGLLFNQYSALSLFTVIGIGCAIESFILVATKLNLRLNQNLIFFLIVVTILLLLFVTFYLNAIWAVPAILLLIGIKFFYLANSVEQKLKSILTFVFSIVYGFFPFFIIDILIYGSNFNVIKYNILFFFILIWFNDTFAYVWGRLFGKHKLAPSISPKKTWEGFIGGFLTTTLVAIFVVPIFFSAYINANIWFLGVTAVAISIIGTLGDLFESMLKRWVGTKDSGNIIPGHGGLLDRFDGVLFAIWPYFAIYMWFLK